MTIHISRYHELTKSQLEAKLKAVWTILTIPLTMHQQSYQEAVDMYNALNLRYAIKTGRNYLPR